MVTNHETVESADVSQETDEYLGTDEEIFEPQVTINQADNSLDCNKETDESHDTVQETVSSPDVNQETDSSPDTEQEVDECVEPQASASSPSGSSCDPERDDLDISPRRRRSRSPKLYADNPRPKRRR